MLRNKDAVIFKNIYSQKPTIMSTKHPGFKATANKIAKKEGVSKQAAGAILASAGRKASPQAKAQNPRLNRIK